MTQRRKLAIMGHRLVTNRKTSSLSTSDQEIKHRMICHHHRTRQGEENTSKLSVDNK